MSDDDFDIEGLANYLHLDPAQVLRLVQRGKVPGRRVGTLWRFSRAEIHHWLEHRIGDSDTDELERVEMVLAADATQAATQTGEEFVSVATLMPAAAIDVSLGARTRSSVIRGMVEVAMGTGWLWDAERMTEAVRSREELHPTALDCGVALLHPRRPLASVLAQPFIAFGRTDGGIPFGGSRGTLTDIFFLLCSTSDRGHLHALARLSRLIADPGLLDQLRSAASAEAVREVILTAEKALPG